MKQLKRLLYYLSINIFVSACTVLAVLSIWERTHPSSAGGIDPLTLIISRSSIPASPSETSSDIPQNPIPTPTLHVGTYQVQPGDTLGDLALRYGISVEELMRLNGLDDPNQLGNGQVLFVPVTLEPSPGVTVQIPATPTPIQPVQEALVTLSGVIGAGDLSSERVVVARLGDGELSLFNWRLEDMNGNSFVFPQLTLYKGGAVNVHTRPGVNTAVDLYWGRDEPAWEPGEIVTLLDDRGNVRATYRVP